MKVVKPAEKKFRSVTLRLPEEVMKRVDHVATKNKVSRQELIAAILKQVLNDDKFVLKIGD
jgi:Ribbon-helix-helix protein, copG family.